MRIQADMITGLCLVTLGAVAGWQALGFDEVSRSYPAALAGLLLIAGLILLVRAWRAGKPKVAESGNGFGVVLLAVIAMGLWVQAFSTGFGFVVPTFLMVSVLMWLGGVRGVARIGLLALLAVVVAYGLFAIVLDVQFPEPVVNWLI